MAKNVFYLFFFTMNTSFIFKMYNNTIWLDYLKANYKIYIKYIISFLYGKT